MARRDFQSLRTLLPQVLSDVAKGGSGAKALLPVWEEAVGAVIARQAQPTAWEGSHLIFAVAETRWLKELDAQEPTLRKRLAEVLGDRAPKKLVFRRPA